MNKTKYDHPFAQVEKFLVAFDQTVDKDNDQQRVLYAKLISEEFAEFLQAYFEKDNVDSFWSKFTFISVESPKICQSTNFSFAMFA